MPLFKADFSDAISRDLDNHMKQVEDGIRASSKLQGHNLTGKMVNSLEQKGTIAEKRLLITDYAQRVNDGMSASEVRAVMASGQRQTFLLGLTKYMQRRIGGSIRNARSAAIATAKVGMREGLPTKASKRFSRNGKRTGFIDDAIANAGPLTRFASFEKLITELPGV